MSGPVSDHVLVNLLFGGQLDTMLREWRRTVVDEHGRIIQKAVSYEEIAARINERVAKIAAECDAPTRQFHWSAIRAWAERISL